MDTKPWLLPTDYRLDLLKLSTEFLDMVATDGDEAFAYDLKKAPVRRRLLSYIKDINVHLRISFGLDDPKEHKDLKSWGETVSKLHIQMDFVGSMFEGIDIHASSSVLPKLIYIRGPYPRSNMELPRKPIHKVMVAIYVEVKIIYDKMRKLDMVADQLNHLRTGVSTPNPMPIPMPMPTPMSLTEQPSLTCSVCLSHAQAKRSHHQFAVCLPNTYNPKKPRPSYQSPAPRTVYPRHTPSPEV